MKKTSVNRLHINKTTLSNLEQAKLQGGIAPTAICPKTMKASICRPCISPNTCAEIC